MRRRRESNGRLRPLPAGEFEKLLGEGLGFGRGAHRDEQSVVAADRADDLGALGLIERDSDEVRGAGRSLDDDEVAGRVDASCPFGQQGAEAAGGPVGSAATFGKRIADVAAAADPHGAEMIEVARDGGLGGREAECLEPSCKLLLAGERLASEQAAERALAAGSGVGHMQAIA